MGWLITIAEASLPLFGVVMVAVQFAALAVGHWLGRALARRAVADRGDPMEGVGVVVSGLLALLAFIMALTVGMASSRFEDRRRVALDEANAIGTAWLRAEAIGHPRGAEIARLLAPYTEARIAWLGATHDSAALDRATAETSRLQGVIWGHATAIGREQPTPMAAALQAALNETFDLAAAQRWAFLGQIPVELPWLLIALSVTSIGAIGYQWGLQRRWHPIMATLLLAAWSGCQVLIADLANPRIGWVRVDPAPYQWTLQGMQGGVVVPPAP